MDWDKRPEWLASLKVGDQVALEQSGFGPKEYYIGTVEKITPTRRRFDVKMPFGSVSEFDADGYAKRTKGSYGSRRCIEPVTEQVKLVNRRTELKRQLERALMTAYMGRLRDDLTVEQMEQIVAILKSDAIPEKE